MHMHVLHTYAYVCACKCKADRPELGCEDGVWSEGADLHDPPSSDPPLGGSVRETGRIRARIPLQRGAGGRDRKDDGALRSLVLPIALSASVYLVPTKCL